MTQPDHSGRRSPRQRADSTHPTPPRPGGRRAVARRPWPTAPGTTRVSPAKPATGTTRSRSRGSALTPTPATVWTTGPAPIDPDATWPVALVDKIVASFSESGAQVVLLAWPTPQRGARLAEVGSDGVIGHAPGTEPDPELADAVNAVDDLGRTGRVERVPADPTATGPASRPFWADLVGDSNPVPATVPAAHEVTVERSTPGGSQVASEGADLIIASLRPEHSGGRRADLVALLAARLLRVGGILVVLTHCDWTTGELTDPTGAVVTAGQNADLLYLQHIIALHTPVRDGRFQVTDEHPGNDSGDGAQARTRHRVQARGLPAPHQRIHSDVLVFAQPQSPAGSRELSGFQPEPTGGLPRSLGERSWVRDEPAEVAS